MGIRSTAAVLLALLVLAGCSGSPHGTETGSAGSAKLTAPAQDPAASASEARTALDLLVKAAGDKRLLLLGETHGTRETPELVGAFVERMVRTDTQVVLALEIDQPDQRMIDRYLESAGRPKDRERLLASPFWQDEMHDGRDSEAMLGLIDSVRRWRVEGLPVSIVAFDSGMPDRDERMADRIARAVEENPDARILVLTGNVHAMVRPPPWAFYDEAGNNIEAPMSMGRYLAPMEPLAVMVQAARGEAWVCSLGRCAAQNRGSGGPRLQHPRLDANTGEESAWDYTLNLPLSTASPPAIDAGPSAGKKQRR